MDVSGISNNIDSNTTITTAKDKTMDDSFEKLLKDAVAKNDEQSLKKVCNQFEGIMLNMMYKEMKATVQKSDLLPDDSAKDIFDSMLDDELMQEASKERSLGLADVLFKQLSKGLNPVNNAYDTGTTATVEKKANEK